MSDVQVCATPPKVFLVGKSTPVAEGIEAYLAHRGVTWNTFDPTDVPEVVVELAGRVCYGSWHNPAKRSRREYVGNMVEHGHGSTMEHLWFNLMVADLPRSVQLELVRHGEGTAFSFESQRFIDRWMRFVLPPIYRGCAELEEIFRLEAEETARTYRWWVEQAEERMERLGLYAGDKTLRRKRAKEAARHCLTNASGSDGEFSLNARAARHIVELRSDEHADLSIREFAHAVFEALEPHLDAVFADAARLDAEYGPPQIKFGTRKV